MQDDGKGCLGGNDMGDENGEDSSVMRIGKRCYVGNLAWKTSWQDLKDKFRDVGNVVYANVMRDDGGKRLPDLVGTLLKGPAHALDVRHKLG